MRKWNLRHKNLIYLYNYALFDSKPITSHSLLNKPINKYSSQLFVDPESYLLVKDPTWLDKLIGMIH